MNAPLSRWFAAAAMTLALTACGESVTAPAVEQPAVTQTVTAQADQDVVTTAAASIAGAIVSLAADEVAAGITAPSLVLVPGDALRDGTSSGTSGDKPPTGGTETGTYGNTTETKSFSRTFTFFNAAGAVMPAFIHGTTASVRAVITAAVRRTRDSTYVSASHSRSDHTLSGLLGDRRIWNGTGASTDTTTHREGTSLRTYVGTSADTTAAVTFLADRTVNRYPLSGTHTRVVNYVKTFTGRETGTLTVTRRIVVTFNGTSSAVMRIGTVTCTLNLETRKAENCS